MKNDKGTFVKPKSDFAIRELLGIENVRKHFISDISGVPIDKIKNTKLLNTFLWRSFGRQKLGIVDALMELQDGTKITVEIQLKAVKFWEKRQLFYWAKIFVKDLLRGANYGKLKKCISIAILDFDLTDQPGAHKVYRLMDEEGNQFGDLLELHTIELGKTAPEDSAVGEWIEFLNAREEADLEMLMSKTKNAGIQEAINAVREYGLFYMFRTYMEYREKARRDRWAEDEYLKDEARKEGKAEGIALINQLYAFLQKQGRAFYISREIQDYYYR